MTEVNNESHSLEPRRAREINIKEILGLMKRKLWLITLITIMITILGAAYSTFTKENVYEASTRAIISADEVDLSTLMVMVEDPEVMEKVIAELNLNYTEDYLASLITVNNIGDSQVVMITVTDWNPQVAADIANSTARIYKQEMARLLSFNDIELLKEAVENPYPINNTGLRPIFLSMLVGLVLSAGAVLVLNTLDETIRTEEDIQHFGIPVIGKIPAMTKKDIKQIQTESLELKVRGDTVGT